jgi:hypothetical protein
VISSKHAIAVEQQRSAEDMIKPRKTDFYVLEEKEGLWILTVLCGGIAMFERTLVLSKEELESIEEWGEYYLEKIALDVAKR